MSDVASSGIEVEAGSTPLTSDGTVPPDEPRRLTHILEEMYDSEETTLAFRDGLVNTGFVPAGADVS